jgi:hypothetical protein
MAWDFLRGGSERLYCILPPFARIATARKATGTARQARDAGHCHIPERRVLAQVKNNLAAPQPSLAYDLVAQASGPPSLAWHGTTVWTAGELLAAARKPAPERDRASDFLNAFLSAGPRLSSDIWAAAQTEDLAERTLNRAKRLLKIQSQRVYEGIIVRSWWLLPGQQLPPEAGAAEEPNELMRLIAEQERKYSHPCPLDDE